MDPLAPDWRTVGAAPTPTQREASGAGPRPERSIPLSARSVAWIAGGLVATALLGAAVSLAIVPTGGGVIIDGNVPAQPMDASADVPTGAALGLASTAAAELVVDVEGAVARPGLVHVPAGGRVGDALTRAGGFAPDADLSRTAVELNLAQPVTDGLKVVVPVLGATTDTGAADPAMGSTSGTPDARTGSAGALVDLNHATEAELDALPGVGPATIAKIIAARQSTPFRDIQDLRTRGIVGEAVYAKLARLVAVGR